VGSLSTTLSSNRSGGLGGAGYGLLNEISAITVWYNCLTDSVDALRKRETALMEGGEDAL
jgi:hypothetical protein